jgi:alanine racemase
MWDSVEEIYPLVKELPVKIILSHLSSAWKADNTKNQLQKQRFNEIIKVFDNKNILYSLSNTDGSRLGSEFTLNIPRTGRGIHGLSYYNSVFGVRKAFEVFAYVVQIKRIKAGAEIGYGGYVKTNEDINLACINIGAYIINQINFPFANEVIWNNQTFNVITIFLGYMMVDFKNSLPNYMDKVELVFYSRFNPETLK